MDTGWHHWSVAIAHYIPFEVLFTVLLEAWGTVPMNDI